MGIRRYARRALALPVVLLLPALFVSAAADPPLLDRDAVFARAQLLAAALLPETAAERLVPFSIDYRLTLLPTGRPDGAFEVNLLIASTRSVVPRADLLAAAEAAERARLEGLLADAPQGYFYRTVKLRFAERGEHAPEAEFDTILLNRDPESPPATAPESP